MATDIEAGLAMRVPQRGFMADQGFFVRYAIILAIFILFGFAQFAMRGFSDFRTAPPMVHLHGGLMVTWLGIFIAQNLLVHRGELAIHRKLGWSSVALMPVIVAVGIAVAVESIRLGRVPPLFQCVSARADQRRHSDLWRNGCLGSATPPRSPVASTSHAGCDVRTD